MPPTQWPEASNVILKVLNGSFAVGAEECQEHQQISRTNGTIGVKVCRTPCVNGKGASAVVAVCNGLKVVGIAVRAAVQNDGDTSPLCKGVCAGIELQVGGVCATTADRRGTASVVDIC